MEPNGNPSMDGMDVFSEGKKHIAAASTVCDATGMLIGYPPAAACSGERLDDAAFEKHHAHYHGWNFTSLC